MFQTSRLVLNQFGIPYDLSVLLATPNGGYNFAVSGDNLDHFYIGGDFPFNHRYFKVAVPNTNGLGLTEVALWDGKNWNPAVDIYDQTSAAGQSLTLSGIISWTPDKNHSWVRDDTNHGNHTITGLEDLKVYDLYWARLFWTNSASTDTELAYVGHKFSNDYDLYIKYPQFSFTDVKNQHTPGKTTWDDQHYAAAQEIIKDLKAQEILFSENQILSWETFKDAAIHKVANMIWSSFGKDWFAHADRAQIEYVKAFNQSVILIDNNGDARVDLSERLFRTGRLIR